MRGRNLTGRVITAWLVPILLGCFSPLAVGQEDRTGRDDRDLIPGMLRDVELSDAQRQEVRKLTESFREKFSALQRRQNDVYTVEQRRTRQLVLREARDAGKTKAEVQDLLADKLKLTDQQQKEIAQLTKEREALSREMRAAYLAFLPADQRPSARGPRQPRIAPTHANLAYGDHKRHLIDVWLAKSEDPTPVLFAIHGGGFRAGNKGVDPGLLNACLEKGISVVAVTYRFSQDAIAPASFHDAARAIQFVRSKAVDWNVDKRHFASTGGSAGAGLSLWLAFHDDLADSGNADPVLRESSRLSCAAVYNGQTTYDPRAIRELIPEADTYQHSALSQLYDVDLSKLDQVSAEKIALFEEVSAMPHLSKDDVPVLLAYASALDAPINNQSTGIHHPRFGTALKKKMDALGIECVVETSSRRGSEKWVQQTVDFVTKHIRGRTGGH